MDLRPKRATRNNKPSYTFDTEQDVFSGNLTEKRKNDILALIKRDLAKPSMAAEVGSAKHLEKLGRETKVLPSDLRKWLGITDDLTQVIVSQVSKEEAKKRPPIDRKAVLDSLCQQVDDIKKQIEDLRRRVQDFQGGTQLYEEETMDLEKEVQEPSKEAKQIQEAGKPEGGLELIPTDGPSSVQEESPMLVESVNLDEDMDADNAHHKG